MISEEHRRRFVSLNGVLPGTFLVDGRIAGTWTVTRERVDTGQVRPRRELATLELRPFDALDATTNAAAVAEGELLVRFVADDATDHRVVVTAP